MLIEVNGGVLFNSYSNWFLIWIYAFCYLSVHIRDITLRFL